jgi:hypothetical protein
LSERILVNFDEVAIEELQEFKMKVGWGKYGDPLDTEFFDMFMRFLRYYGEFLVSQHIQDHKGMMIALADIKNGCDLLYPHIQESYIEFKKNQSKEVDKQTDPFRIMKEQPDPGHEDSRFME